MTSKTISRRSFLGGAGVLAAGVAAASMAGCAPTQTKESTQAGADEVKPAADGTPNWLGSAPEIDESNISNVLTSDLVIAGAGNGGLAAAAYAADKGIDFMIFEVAQDVSTTRNWFAAVTP